MYIIPLTNSPNQSFVCTIPINGENKELRFSLWYNYQAEYWLLSLSDVKSGEELIANFPLLTSKNRFFNILAQVTYMNIGMCFMLPSVDKSGEYLSQASDENIATDYYMIWGDND